MYISPDLICHGFPLVALSTSQRSLQDALTSFDDVGYVDRDILPEPVAECPPHDLPALINVLFPDHEWDHALAGQPTLLESI